MRGLLFVVALVAGCFAPPQADTVADEAEPESLAYAGWVVQANTAREVSHERPRLWLGPADYVFSAWESDGDPPAECPFQVHSSGLPAIAEDGATLVLPPATFDNHRRGQREVRLVWGLQSISLSVDVLRPTDVAPGRALDRAPCAAAYAEAHRRVAALDRRLAQGRWHSLERADVAFPVDAEADAQIEKLPLAERPIELVYHGGRLIARVRDVQVLDSQVRPDLRQLHDESCSDDPLFEALWIDRRTRQGVLHYHHDHLGCLCVDFMHYATIPLSDALLDVL